MPAKVLVSDTNIWIDLHRGGLLEAVFSLPNEFVTTDFVWHELRHPPGSDLSALGLTVLPLSGEEVADLADALKMILDSGGRLPKKECKVRIETWLAGRYNAAT